MFHCNHSFNSTFLFVYNNHLFAQLYGIKYSYLIQIIWLIDWTLTGNTTLGQIEKVLSDAQYWSLIIRCSWVSYPRQYPTINTFKIPSGYNRRYDQKFCKELIPGKEDPNYKLNIGKSLNIKTE